MEITEEKITEAINENKDISFSIILLRLYDEYQAVSQTEQHKYQDISLLKLQSARRAIIQNINAMLCLKESYFTNKKIVDKIQTDVLLLNDCFTNFDIHNQSKFQKTIDLITTLECLLKLPITFPFNIKHCIENQLKNQELYQNKKR